jgi:hypothetical protein
MINRDLIHELNKEFKEARYRECNYYMADTLLASTALEWVVKRLQGRLAKCLNADKGYCDLWYLESHIECNQLMSILYELSANEIYNPKLF